MADFGNTAVLVGVKSTWYTPEPMMKKGQLSSKVYWWVALLALLWMILLLWFTQSFNIPLGAVS